MMNPKQTNMRPIKAADQGSDKEKDFFKYWIETKDDEAGNSLVKKYTPLVHIIVEKIYHKLPKSVSKEELISLGLYGLYEALDKYDPDRELKFETYASFRIRGAVLDGLRKEDWLPRKTREKAKKLEALARKLEQKHLRNVTIEEIANEAEMDPEEAAALLDDSFFSNILSIDEKQKEMDDDGQSFVIKDETVKTPEEELLHRERMQELTSAIKKLSEREQLVLSLFYKEELTLTEIGQMIGLSTSRISQIHSKTIRKLKHLLEN